MRRDLIHFDKNQVCISLKHLPIDQKQLLTLNPYPPRQASVANHKPNASTDRVNRK